MDPIRRDDFVIECIDCNHVFVERLELPMGVDAFVRRLNSWSCTKCDKTAGVMVLTDDRRREAVEKLTKGDADAKQ